MQERAAMLGPSTVRARNLAGERVLGARYWTAPRLRRAAGYVENELAPRFGSALSSTAKRIEPSRPGHRIRNTILVIFGTAGAIGAAGALFARYRLMSDNKLTGQVDSVTEIRPERTISDAEADVVRHVGESPAW
jgi:hypothetical protein